VSVPASASSSQQQRLVARIVDDAGQLAPLTARWDELAAAAGCPAALSGWQLAWWRTFAPAGAALRVVVVEEDGQVVGIAPFWTTPKRLGATVYRLLGAPMTHRVAPVAEPSRRAAVAAAVAQALAGADPAPDYVAFEAADARGEWREALAAAWPGAAPHTLHERTMPAPTLAMPLATFDEWLGTKSRNFRQQARRFRRRLEQADGRVRLSTPAELDADVDAFVRLHLLRWEGRGGSSLGERIGVMLRAAGRALQESGGFRLWVCEVEGRAVSAQIFLAAGDHVLYWNGGFDPDFAQFKPALVGIIAGVEDSLARGERHLDLGGGDHDYKLRIADGDEPLTWEGLVPRGRGYLRARAALLPRQAAPTARELFKKLPPDVQRRVRERVVR
jgi:CelD/BcsL family acetyltransferase involved in cellulose biosynthesis